jgi:hypothetical protein
MAARTTKGTKDVPWDERTRQRIKTSMLVNRLSDHVLGNADMSATQIRAAEILLNKTLANLTATELRGSVASYVARLPDVAPNAQAWLDAVKPMLTAAPVSQPLANDTHEDENTNDINVLGEDSTS